MDHPSAGGIVLNPDGKIALTNQNSDSWSLPKGHIDAGESVEQAALREIAEETGLKSVTIVESLGSYERPQIGKGGVGENLDNIKYITMFLCTTVETELKPTDPANPEAKWVDPNEVAAMLTHPKDKAFYESCLPKITEYLRPQA